MVQAQPVAAEVPIVQKEPSPQIVEQPKPIEPIVQKEPTPVAVEPPKPVVEAPKVVYEAPKPTFVAPAPAPAPVINEEKPPVLVISGQFIC